MQEYFNEHTDQFYQRLRLLLTGRLRGQQAPAEEKELADWISMSESNAALFERLTDEDKLDEHLDFLYRLDEEEAWKRVWERACNLGGGRTHVIEPVRSRSGVLAAAIFIFLLILAGGYYFVASNNLERKMQGRSLVKIPGKMMRMLDTGRPLALQDTIRTMNGQRREWQLEDGTTVWLNNHSMLCLPRHFSSMQREVRLEGEAFFEVKKDRARPFRVNVDGETIEVLGTSFNVRAYPGTGQHITTLLQGSLRVKDSLHEALLMPGEQATAREGMALRKRRAPDLAQVLAWKRGYLKFNDAPLADVLQDVERWFDVRSQIHGRIDLHFNVTLEPSMSLREFMRIIAATGGIRCEVRGTTVDVYAY